MRALQFVFLVRTTAVFQQSSSQKSAINPKSLEVSGSPNDLSLIKALNNSGASGRAHRRIRRRQGQRFPVETLLGFVMGLFLPARCPCSR